MNDDGSVYLSTGLEIRTRYEGFGNVAREAARDGSYIWHRAMPYADLHVGPVRLFALPILSGIRITGADRPKRAVDTTGADMLGAGLEAKRRQAASDHYPAIAQKLLGQMTARPGAKPSGGERCCRLCEQSKRL